MILQFNLLSTRRRFFLFVTTHGAWGIEFPLSHRTDSGMTGVVKVDKVESDDKGTEDGGTDSDFMLGSGGTSKTSTIRFSKECGGGLKNKSTEDEVNNSQDKVGETEVRFLTLVVMEVVEDCKLEESNNSYNIGCRKKGIFLKTRISDKTCAWSDPSNPNFILSLNRDVETQTSNTEM